MRVLTVRKPNSSTSTVSEIASYFAIKKGVKAIHFEILCTPTVCVRFPAQAKFALFQQENAFWYADRTQKLYYEGSFVNAWPPRAEENAGSQMCPKAPKPAKLPSTHTRAPAAT